MGSSSSRRRIARALDSFFKVSERGSTIATELRAGLVTFLTMSYILLVNPQILENAGLDKERTATATAVCSAIATLITGLLGNLPFGLSPGVGVNTLFALTQVKIMGHKPETAFAWCLVASATLAVLASCRLLNVVMAVVPGEIKQGTVVGMGLLLAFIGLKDCGIVVANEETLVMLGPVFSNWHALVCIVEGLVIATLMHHGVKTGVLLGIVGGTLACWISQQSWPHQLVHLPDFAACFRMPNFQELSWGNVHNSIPYLLILIFDIGGAMFGLGNAAGLVSGHHLKGSVWCYLGAACGSAIGAFIGTTPLIVACESAAGIQVGGRTGLTAVSIAFFFMLSIFFAPLVVAIPLDATAPVLILVGTLMMSESSSIEWHSISIALPAFLTIAIQPLTFSIANGIYAGVASAFVLWITSGKAFSDLKKLRRSKPSVSRYWDGPESPVDSITATVGSNQQPHSLIGEPEEGLQPDCSERVDLQTGQSKHPTDVYNTSIDGYNILPQTTTNPFL